MSFRRRDYLEVLDGLLTALVGGVSAESHAFPPPGDAEPPRHQLEAPPARALVSVFGARNGASVRFRAGNDVALTPDGRALVWAEGGDRPDPGTMILVNYLREGAQPTLSDIEVGSVARTLTEAVAMESARLYAQMQAVYDAGFIDTATGRSLERVVALLGIERVGAGRPVATLRFRRARGAPGAITIPAGTRVIDAGVSVEYETLETVTMDPAQDRVTVEARDLEPANSPAPADMLTVLTVPITGIAGVTNPAAATRAAAAEADAALRQRARGFLHASERATLGALENVLAKLGLKGEIGEPEDRPGVVVVTPVAGTLSAEQTEQLRAALYDARPAGVRVELAGAMAPARVHLDLALVTRETLSQPSRRAAHAAVRKAVADFFDDLRIGDDARINRLVGAVMAVPGVEDVTLQGARKIVGGSETDVLDAAAGILRLAAAPTVLADLALADPALPTTADLVVRFPATAAAPDHGAVTAALEAAFAEAAKGAARVFAWGHLLRVLPPPVGGGESYASWDQASPSPALPTEPGDYDLTLLIHQASGLTRILTGPDDSYTLAAGERLRLDAVTLEPVAGG
jgi:uncharacterized phage protein gp47/JayE